MGISSIEETWVAVTWMSGALAIEFGLEARRERLAGAAYQVLCEGRRLPPANRQSTNSGPRQGEGTNRT